MWERRIRDWKQLCQINMNKLIAILYNEVYVEPQITTDTAADGDVAASTIGIIYIYIHICICLLLIYVQI
jgi:hypothetical protein